MGIFDDWFRSKEEARKGKEVEKQKVVEALSVDGLDMQEKFSNRRRRAMEAKSKRFSVGGLIDETAPGSPIPMVKGSISTDLHAPGFRGETFRVKDGETFITTAGLGIGISGAKIRDGTVGSTMIINTDCMNTRDFGGIVESAAKNGLDPELSKLLTDTINDYHAKLTEGYAVTEEKKDPQVEAMKEVAEHLTNQWALETPTFTLSAPASLTVLKEDNNYSKQAHIGGEEFKAVSAYVGKRGAIICVFTPVAVERYTQMEMPYNDCVTSFRGFRSHATDVGATGKLAIVTDAKKRIAQAIELEEKSKVYADFGEF